MGRQREEILSIEAMSGTDDQDMMRYDAIDGVTCRPFLPVYDLILRVSQHCTSVLYIAYESLISDP